MTTVRQDLTRTLLSVICLLVLIAGSLWILRPFLGAGIWATMLVVTTWPILKWLEARFGKRRGPAVAVMTVALLLLLVVPLWVAISTIAGYSDEVGNIARRLSETGLPQPPAWLAKIPIVGDRLFEKLATWADAGPAALHDKVEPYLASVAKWIVERAGSLGGTLLQFLLVIVLSAVLFTKGEAAADGVVRFFRRLAGARGEESVVLAGKAIRSVALGVGVTAVIQTVLGGAGLAICGVPYTSLLTAVILMLCIAQLGPALVLFPVVAWMYWKGDSGWATFLLVWSVVVASLDNFLRPMLIKRGADLPLLLIFAGVIGGLVGFGLVGLFVGPVLLAVTYTLLVAWIEDALGPPVNFDEHSKVLPGGEPS